MNVVIDHVVDMPNLFQHDSQLDHCKITVLLH